MADLQQQARALGDPTRYRVFRYLADADRPVGVAELTAQFGFNHNAIRQHLAKLVDARLVSETTAPTGGSGRPPLAYEVSPGVDSRWGVTGPYERLSLLLTEIINTADAPERVGWRAGQRYRKATADSVGVVDNLADTMARMGFEPTVRARGKLIDVVLNTCPFATTAVADPDIVCALHLGMARGITDATDIVVDELIAKDPRRAKCRLRLHIEPHRADDRTTRRD